ncbi:hypothetical protein DPMN_137715 [Dreissena polymorpha]|uniref:Mab-21-like HhH/H2TH-like domain-containing protein n=1 Tax=Dreissena polymorpha TaxID=45954 RepID=A0A9D4G392_DREPO|nr:hypothetical protein DPMN_137715 [Dreissena polymorpha]
MIVKDVLRPSKKEITSYVMKNIVLWQAERNPQNKFYAQSFLHWLHDGLRALRTAIVTQQLSYYMITERNSMAASGLTYRQQSHWVEVITDTMAEGPRVILGLPKIRRAIVASPEPILWYSMKRMELEMLNLEVLNRLMTCIVNGVVEMTDAIIHEIQRRKMIVKDVLRPSKKEITSYVLKNIVLWHAESNPQNKFYARIFFHWLHAGLR